MVHNVRTEPAGMSDTQQVLTIIADPDYPGASTREVEFRNQGRRLVVSGLGSVVQGEDLFALREFLAELPEGSFVRPADPVTKPRWTNGDLVAPSYDSVILYRRINGKWDRIFRSSVAKRYTDDTDISDWVDDLGYVVLFQQSTKEA